MQTFLGTLFLSLNIVLFYLMMKIEVLSSYLLLVVVIVLSLISSFFVKLKEE